MSWDEMIATNKAALVDPSIKPIAVGSRAVTDNLLPINAEELRGPMGQQNQEDAIAAARVQVAGTPNELPPPHVPSAQGSGDEAKGFAEKARRDMVIQRAQARDAVRQFRLGNPLPLQLQRVQAVRNAFGGRNGELDPISAGMLFGNQAPAMLTAIAQAKEVSQRGDLNKSTIATNAANTAREGKVAEASIKQGEAAGGRADTKLAADISAQLVTLQHQADELGIKRQEVADKGLAMTNENSRAVDRNANEQVRLGLEGDWKRNEYEQLKLQTALKGREVAVMEGEANRKAALEKQAMTPQGKRIALAGKGDPWALQGVKQDIINEEVQQGKPVSPEDAASILGDRTKAIDREVVDASGRLNVLGVGPPLRSQYQQVNRIARGVTNLYTSAGITPENAKAVSIYLRGKLPQEVTRRILASQPNANDPGLTIMKHALSGQAVPGDLLDDFTAYAQYSGSHPATTFSEWKKQSANNP